MYKFDDMTEDDVFDGSSDIDPESVGRVFALILTNLIRDRGELSTRERVAIAIILLTERLEREGTLGG